jgi:hypothetical protein
MPRPTASALTPNSPEASSVAPFPGVGVTTLNLISAIEKPSATFVPGKFIF